VKRTEPGTGETQAERTEPEAPRSVFPDTTRGSAGLPAGGFLTVRQVADLLQMDPKTVKRWIYGGLLKASRTGGHIRIDPLELRYFLYPDERPRAVEPEPTRKRGRGRKAAAQFKHFPIP
jgi:excisionase family DNA binding protein